ncbi:hypothetical protein F5Y04DRAFT_235244 [Hypomontagnella monticulosa]|nr:hypothetical protein F5Y04DRAFT_235244 [Hypomontagnella monticulosa]
MFQIQSRSTTSYDSRNTSKVHLHVYLVGEITISAPYDSPQNLTKLQTLQDITSQRRRLRAVGLKLLTWFGLIFLADNLIRIITSRQGQYQRHTKQAQHYLKYLRSIERYSPNQAITAKDFISLPNMLSPHDPVHNQPPKTRARNRSRQSREVGIAYPRSPGSFFKDYQRRMLIDPSAIFCRDASSVFRCKTCQSRRKPHRFNPLYTLTSPSHLQGMPCRLRFL